MPDELLAPESPAAAPEAVSKPEDEEAVHENATTISEYLESLLVTVILALFGTTFVVQAFKIPSQSMERTLLVGDHLLVNKFIFGGRARWYEKYLPYRDLQRGDIIVFKYPYQDHPHFVKRVIGLPGEHLKIVDQQVYVNGKLLNEPYVFHDPASGYDPLNYTFPPPGNQILMTRAVLDWAHEIRKYVQGDELVIPTGKYFVMGDNRDQSSDSRYWGFVDRDAIMGRPFLIYWSVDASTTDYADSSFVQRIMAIFDTLMHLPSRTRWSRMLRTVH